jgi:hypothetical protein
MQSATLARTPKFAKENGVVCRAMLIPAAAACVEPQSSTLRLTCRSLVAVVKLALEIAVAVFDGTAPIGVQN